MGWSFFTHSDIAIAALDSLELETLDYLRGNVPVCLFKRWIGFQASFVDLDRYFVRDLVPGHSFLLERYSGIEELTMIEILELPGMKKNALGALIDAYYDLRELNRLGDFAGASYAMARMFHFASDLTMPLHVVRNSDGQLTGQPGLHVRIESVAGNLFFSRRLLSDFRPRVFSDKEIPVVLVESINISTKQAEIFEIADMRRLSEPFYSFQKLWRDIQYVFVEATGRAAFLCASLLVSSIAQGAESNTPRLKPGACKGSI